MERGRKEEEVILLAKNEASLIECGTCIQSLTHQEELDHLSLKFFFSFFFFLDFRASFKIHMPDTSHIPIQVPFSLRKIVSFIKVMYFF